MFSDEGRRFIDSPDMLFPPTVRPNFLRLLWIALLLIALATVVLAILAGRLT